MMRITYKDGNNDGRVVVKVNGQPVGFYMTPKGRDCYMFFFDQGRSLETFALFMDMESFIRKHFSVAVPA